jgi:hypothetical protein
MSANLVVGMLASALSYWQPAEDRSAYLLLYPAVQKELVLSDDQSERVKEIFGSLESRPKAEREALLNERLKTLLKAPQSERLGEIRAQVLAARGVLPKELIADLKLSDEQRKRLDDVLTKNEAENRKLKRLLMTGNYRSKEALEAVKKKYYEPARERLQAALTPEQWQTVQRRQGKEFPGAFEMAQDF